MALEILCTTDFSDSSHDALRWSIELSRKLGAHLTILHAYRLLKHDGEVVKMKRIIEEEATRNFGVWEKELLADAGISFDFKTEVGFVADRVKEYIRKHNVSFLVMGKNATGNKENFDEMVKHLQVPLVIVPPSVQESLQSSLAS
jgi:nucleotide-binding universal stress UspA family protein